MKLPPLSSKKFKHILEKNGELSPHYIKLVLKQLGFSKEEIQAIFF